MNQSINKTLRICIVSDQLATGGAERCAALLSIFFENNQCKVHHLIVVDKIEYQYSGEVFNMGKLKNNSNGVFNKAKRFYAMKRFFNINVFDFILDFRVKRFQFQEFFISKFIYNAPIIVSVRSYMTELYFPKNIFLANSIYSKSKKIITVSKVIEEKIRNEYPYTQVKTIYNPLDFEAIEALGGEDLAIDFEYVIAAGRMNDEVKQFGHLIETYSKSELPSKNIKLILLGDGILKEKYQKLVQKLNLEKMILFKGNVSNPFQYMKRAKLLLLTSKNEGFPNVIIESLACKTPVIAFDCQSGPSEIIIPNENGILVENQNFNAFKEALNEMISNKNLYLHCKQNAKSSVERFSLKQIGNQWLQLFNEIDK